MDVLISGSRGLIGSALASALDSNGYHVRRLIRQAPLTSGDVYWDPPRTGPQPGALEGLGAVVHLAGATIASRWTRKRKQEIFESRVQGTRLLSESLARTQNPPKTLICASAIGFYGSRGDELLTEDSSKGQGFLAETCDQWERAASPAVERGIRVVHARLGIVLSPKGGALATMLFPFKLGLGGSLGNGRQWMSWVALDDVLSTILVALQSESVKGPLNVVAPRPVTNLEFTKTLAATLGRPAIFPVPAQALRLIFGGMADEALLSSARVEPRKLIQMEYRFRYAELGPALQGLLGR